MPNDFDNWRIDPEIYILLGLCILAITGCLGMGFFLGSTWAP